MMREIKFRFYDKDNRKMLNDLDVLGLTINELLESDDEWAVMQCTGLLDKNGIEIYEGDIVTYRDKEMFFIEYNQNRAEYRAVYHKEEDRDIYTDRLISKRCEVIGNIHKKQGAVK